MSAILFNYLAVPMPPQLPPLILEVWPNGVIPPALKDA